MGRPKGSTNSDSLFVTLRRCDYDGTDCLSIEESFIPEPGKDATPEQTASRENFIAASGEKHERTNAILTKDFRATDPLITLTYPKSVQNLYELPENFRDVDFSRAAKAYVSMSEFAGYKSKR